MEENKRRACRRIEELDQTYEDVLLELKGIYSIFTKLRDNIESGSYTEDKVINQEIYFNNHVCNQLEIVISKLELFS